MNQTYHCRVCWNTNGWQKPSGDAAKLETQSYVHINRFGHEEWLFNFGWTIEGFKYGFIQGFTTKNQKYQQGTFDVMLYTISHLGNKYLVGKITSCQVLSQEMSSKALKIYKKQKWLDEMVDDVKKVDGNYKLLLTARNPLSILNVRFQIDDVKPFDLIELPENHPLQNYHRYKPRDLGKDLKYSFLSQTSPPKFNFRSGHIKDTERRERAAQSAIEYDPAHNRLQNVLFPHLIEIYGKENVGYEVSHIDLAAKENGKFILFEIKTEPTAKRCIRLAIGQLLEYAHWSNDIEVKELIVIGKVLPTQYEKDYLNLLRQRYNLPIYYQRYDSVTNHLSEKY